MDKLTELQQFLVDNAFIDKKLAFIDLRVKAEAPLKASKKPSKTQELVKKEKIEYFDENSIKVYQKQQKLN